MVPARRHAPERVVSRYQAGPEAEVGVAVPELAQAAVPPAEGLAPGRRRAGVKPTRVDLLPVLGPGHARGLEQPGGGAAVADLAGRVQTPAVQPVVGGDRAAVIEAHAHLAEREGARDRYRLLAAGAERAAGAETVLGPGPGAHAELAVAVQA